MNPELTKQHLSTRIFKSYLWYLARHYPQIDLNELSNEAGLPLSYINEENNWVSATFDAKFTKLCIEKTNCEDLCYRVGLSSLSEELVGQTMFRLAKYGMTSEQVYKNITGLASRFSKITNLHIVAHSAGIFAIRLTTNVTALTPDEQSALKLNLQNIIRNTEGYFAAVPTLHGRDHARVRVREIQDGGEWPIFEFEVGFIPHWQSAHAMSSLIAISLGALSLVYWWDWVTKNGILSAALGTGLPMAAFTAFLSYKYKGVKGALDHSGQSLQRLDDQYLALQDAKESLARRLQEAQLIQRVSENLKRARSKRDVLENSCHDIVNALRYDRVVIFIGDEKKGDLTYGASHGADADLESVLKRFSQPIDIPSNDPSKLSNVFRTGVPVLIAEVISHMPSLNEESRALLTATRSTSFLCVAIASEKQKHGVMCIDYFEKRKALSEADLQLMQVVAHQIAIALDKEVAQETVVSTLVEADKQKGELLESYSRFIPFEFIRLLGRESILDVSLGDHSERDMTVFFSDIRNFTSFAEVRTPKHTLEYLNAYYALAAPIIHKFSGQIDKYMGDGMMALFEDHSSALFASIEISKTLADFCPVQEIGPYWKSRTGIGLNAGRLVLGTIGYAGQMQCTVISDVVNTAQRLEALTKDFGASLIVSEEVLCRVEAAKLPIRRTLGQVHVRNRKEPVKVWDIFATDDTEQVRLKQETKETFELGVEMYTSGRLQDAVVCFQDVLNKNPQDSCAQYFSSRLKKQGGIRGLAKETRELSSNPEVATPLFRRDGKRRAR